MAKGIEKIELNRAGVAELMKSSEMLGLCESLAQKTAGSLGEGYEVSTYVGRTRANASIVATTQKAIKDNMENNSVLKAIGSI